MVNITDMIIRVYIYIFVSICVFCLSPMAYSLLQIWSLNVSSGVRHHRGDVMHTFVPMPVSFS